MRWLLRRPRRKLWRVLLRAGALAAAVLAVLYATLPWWVPKGLVVEQLAAKLSSQLGVKVTVEGMEMSWPEGVSLKGVTIFNSQDFGGGEMVSVGRLRCELAPLAMLLGRQVGWAELTDAVLHVVVNDDRRANLALLEPLLKVPAPPRLSVLRAAVTLQLPHHDRLLRLDVSDMRYSAGRLKSLGRITMSAQLAQAGTPAPVTLLGSASGHSSVVSNVSTSFRFRGVDIAQLHLPGLLGLPLKRLHGVGSGQLDCEIGGQSIVEKFRCSLIVKNLDAQPRMGPALPIIETAELAVGGNYDLVNEVMRADSFRLRLPGVDLSGKGDVHAAVFLGGWAGVHSLEATGTVNPAMFVALLRGRPAPLPGQLAVDGDVKLQVSLDNRSSHLLGGVMLDATAAGLRRGERLLKPAGRTLSAEFRGRVRLGGAWKFTADQTELRIGENRFVGSGAMQNIRRVLSEWLGAEGSPTPAMLLECLAGLDWRGSFHIVELVSVTDLLGLPAAQPVRLTGPAEGLWSVTHTDAVWLRGSLRLPRQTQLRVGDWFAKPPGKEMRAELATEVAPAAAELRSVALRVAVGPAAFVVEQGSVALLVAGGESGGLTSVRAGGRFELRGAAGLLTCVPAASEWTKKLNGAVAGEFQVSLGTGRRRIYLKANATQMDLDLGQAFAKAAGQPADVLVDFSTDDGLPRPLQNCLEFRLQLGSSTALGRAHFPPAGDGPWAMNCRGRIRVTEASWLLKRSPALARVLEEWDVGGGIEATVRGNLGPEGWAGQLSCDADDLQFRLPGWGGAKVRGSALRLRLGGRGSGGQALVHFTADVGRSGLSGAGTVTLAEERKLPPPGTAWPAPGVAGVDLRLRGRLVLDRAARALVPSLAEHMRRWGVEGSLRAEVQLIGDMDALNASGSLDASDLALAVDGKLRKPAGVPTSLRFEATVPADMTEVRVGELFLETPPMQVLASGSMRLRPVGDLAGRVAVNVPRLRQLVDYSPDLSPYRPAGGVFVELDLVRASGETTIRSATISTREASAVIAKKVCRVDGELVVTDAVATRRLSNIGRIASNSLEWALGQSHGFVVADVKDPIQAPSGRFELLCTCLDTKELMDWLGPAGTARGPLEQKQRVALASRGEAAIGSLKELLASAALSGRIVADRAIYFDPSVRAAYELRNLSADVDAAAGRAAVGLRAGLNGGQLHQTYKLDLNQPQPRVHHRNFLREVAAKENIQLQLTRDFPGNTVSGTFSREDEVTYPLLDFVMNSLDERHRLIPTGRAKTVTTDGILRGRAAPKFIAKVFPGLNLATYKYRVMTAFADLQPDGTAVNDMLFSGATYDIYMEGTTDIDNIARYSTGVLLFPVPASPEIAHGLRQGRIPIFNFKARIEGGKFHDQQVRYPLPTETAYTIFLKNNLLFRLWVAARARKGASVIAPQAGTGLAGGSERSANQ